MSGALLSVFRNYRPFTANGPGAPTNVTATATGPNSATVSFTAPAVQGYFGIIDYYITTGGPQLFISSQQNQITTAFFDLSPGTSYAFTVYARHASTYSSGPASVASNSVTPNFNVGANPVYLNNTQFTVPAGVSTVKVKLWGQGHANSGAEVIGDFAVIAGDVLNFGQPGLNTAASVQWYRSAALLGFAIAGEAGKSGNDADDGGDNWQFRYGGNGGAAGIIGFAAGDGESSYNWITGGTGAGYSSAGTAGYSYGTNAANGSSPSGSGYAAWGGNGGPGEIGDHSDGGQGGDGGSGYYGGGGGGGGGDADTFPDSGAGGGGGGGGSSFASGMTGVTSQLASDSGDAHRGNAGSPDYPGKVVMIY